MSTQLITNEQLYEQVIKKVIKAKRFVWIGTADIKGMHVKHNGKMISFLAILNILINKRKAVRLLHAKEPGKNFRESFDKSPNLWINLECQLCSPFILST